MPVIFKNDNKGTNIVVEGDIILPVSEVTVLISSIVNNNNNNNLGEANEDNDVFADAFASIEGEENLNIPYKKGDIIEIKTDCKIRSSESKSWGIVNLRNKEEFSLIELGQKVIRMDGSSEIKINALVTDTPSKYIQNGDMVVEVTPL